MRRSLTMHVMRVVVACLLAVATLSASLAHQAYAAPRYAAMVVDGHTGRILYSRNGDKLRYPASLTKVMTLYLLFDYMEAGKLKLRSRLVVSANAAKQPPSKLGFKAGQTISVRDAIRALVTKSANDVAVAVAENIGGSEAKFAKLMTAKARKIGMKRTVFVNASGLPNKHQVTTARDMITLANHLMFDHPEKYAYFSQKYFKYRGKKYRNHNRLLFDYKGTDGIKTGYTRASGFNLLANVHRGKKHLIAVVFGGKTSGKRNAAMRRILNKSIPRAVARLPRKHRKVPRKSSHVASAAKFPEKAARSALTAVPEKKPAPPPSASKGQEIVAALPAPPGTKSNRAGGGQFQIQVGAYSRETDAMERLAAIQERAGDVLKKHTPLTVPLSQSKRSLYRARFAGFTRSTADSTCHQLKQRAITCVVMSAE